VDRARTDRITSLAADQHGLVTTAQLEELEIGRRGFRQLIDDGWLQPLAPRVYGIAGVPASTERHLMLGLLSLGDAAVVSHEAAARLHGFDRSPVDAVEFTVPRARRNARIGFVVHSTGSLPAVDRVRVAGFRCTSATRTLIDLARERAPAARLEAAIDSAVRSGASAPIVIARRLDDLRGPGRWGVRTLDRLLVDAGGHSMLERRFLELVRRAGLPRPVTQVVHRDGTRTFARVDFLWPDLGVVVEVSGRRGHASDAGRARDAQRRNELQDAGLRVYEYTWDDVTRRGEHVRRTLRTRLRASVPSA
jgi:hypothetical protein